MDCAVLGGRFHSSRRRWRFISSPLSLPPSLWNNSALFEDQPPVLPTGATRRVPSTVALWKPFESVNSAKTTRCALATPPLAIFCHFGKYDVDRLTCYEVQSRVVGLTPFLLHPSFVVIRRPGNRRRLHHHTAHPFTRPISCSVCKENGSSWNDLRQCACRSLSTCVRRRLRPSHRR
jgi:hypothetical protein